MDWKNRFAEKMINWKEKFTEIKIGDLVRFVKFVQGDIMEEDDTIKFGMKFIIDEIRTCPKRYVNKSTWFVFYEGEVIKV